MRIAAATTTAAPLSPTLMMCMGWNQLAVALIPGRRPSVTKRGPDREAERPVPRGTGRGAFIDSVLEAIDSFYEEVIQNLKPWLPTPPKLRSVDDAVAVEPVPAALSSTAISSQDGPEPAADGLEERPV
jgi:hypothetical protein